VRKGGKKAIVAVGHKIIIAVYHVLAKKEVIQGSLDLSNAKHDAKKRQRRSSEKHYKTESIRIYSQNHSCELNKRF